MANKKTFEVTVTKYYSISKTYKIKTNEADFVKAREIATAKMEKENIELHELLVDDITADAVQIGK